MKILSATYFRGETTTIITTDEFDALGVEDQLHVLKELILDLRNIYSDKLREQKTKNPKSQVSIKKKADTRAMLALNLRNNGLTFRAIGEHLGVSASRASQLVNKATRMVEREKRWRNT